MTDSVCARKLEEMDDIDENIIANNPWAQQFLTRVLKLTKKAVLNWLCVLQKIGNTQSNNDEYGHVFIDNLTTLYEDLIFDMEILREKILDKLVRNMEQLNNLCKDLQITIPELDHQHKPLAMLLNELETNLKMYEEMVEERIKIINNLNEQIKLLCGEFGRKPDLLSNKSPLPTVEQIEQHRKLIKHLEDEKKQRLDKFQHLHKEILQLSYDLDYEGRTNFERFILSKQITDVDIKIIIKDKEMEKIIEFHRDLCDLKCRTLDEITTIKETILQLWNVLDLDLCQRDLFLMKYNKMTSLKTLEMYKNELNRLEMLKKENMKKFIQQQRNQLQELWLKCNLTEQQQEEFKYFYSDCYTEDLYDLHQCELEKWQQYFNENKTILLKLHDYRQLWQEYQQLVLNNDNKERYKNRGGQLLIEEKLRKKLIKNLTKLENNLQQLHNDYQINNNGRTFLTFGQTIPNYLQTLQYEFDKKCKEKLSARKIQRDKTTTTTTITKSRTNLFQSNSNLLKVPPSPNFIVGTPGSVKRKLMATPRTGGGGDTSIKKIKNSPKSLTKKPTLNVSHKRRSSKKFRNMKKKKQTTTAATATTSNDDDSIKENIHETISTDYGDFAKDLSKKNTTYRSTTFLLKENGNDNNNIDTPKKTPFSILPHGSRLNTKF